MLISLIVACSENWVIGKNNQLPWHLPEDLKHFKNMTVGKPIIMGRKTYESIGHPLKNRHNIILTKDIHYRAEGCTIVHSAMTALKVAEDLQASEVVIIGGAKVYEAFLPKVQVLYLSLVHGRAEGDTFFPALQWEEWLEESKLVFDKFTIKHLRRKAQET